MKKYFKKNIVVPGKKNSSEEKEIKIQERWGNGVK